MLGERLARARKRAGMTQVELAVALNKDRSLISKVETGVTWAGMAETMLAVANELNVSLDYLFGRIDDPTSPGAEGSTCR